MNIIQATNLRPRPPGSGIGPGSRPSTSKRWSQSRPRALPGFEFTSGKIVFGRNAFEKVPSLVQGYQQQLEEDCGVFIVCGSADRLSRPLAGALGSAGVDNIKVFHVAKEPTVELVQEATREAKGCGVVVAVGGGAAIDTAKAVSVMLTNGGADPDPLDFLEVVGRGLPIEKPGVPFIACPSTAGVGSEVTKNAVLGAGPQKVSMRSPFLVPSVAVVDPVLTVSCPKTTTAYTGLDALVQCIEPYCTHLATPLSDLYARQGIVYGARSLRLAFDEPQNLDAREDMSLCGLFSGVALANSKLGSVHGFAGVLGGMFPTAPHGAVCGRLLPPCWKSNYEACQSEGSEQSSKALKRMEEVASLLLDRQNASVEEAHAWMRSLVEHLQVPGLRSWGMGEKDIPMAVEKSAGSSSMQGNPVKLSHGVLADILAEALD